MSATATYLEQAKLDELEQQYRTRGYKVRRGYRAESGTRYDLVATQGDKRIVVEVKASPSLAGQGKSLRELRRRAYDDGFTDFRLVVVSPPHRTDVSVLGLEGELAEYLREHVPEALQGLASSVLIDAVSNLDYDTIRATKEGLDIAGDGVVEVTLAYGGTRDPAHIPDDFPFRFHALVGPDLRLARLYSLVVDVSAFDGQIAT